MNGAHAALAALAGLLTDEPLPPDGLQMLRRELAT